MRAIGTVLMRARREGDGGGSGDSNSDGFHSFRF